MLELNVHYNDVSHVATMVVEAFFFPTMHVKSITRIVFASQH